MTKLQCHFCNRVREHGIDYDNSRFCDYCAKSNNLFSVRTVYSYTYGKASAYIHSKDNTKFFHFNLIDNTIYFCDYRKVLDITCAEVMIKNIIE